MATPWNMAKVASLRPLRKPYKPVAPVGVALTCDETLGDDDEFERRKTSVFEYSACNDCGYHVCDCVRQQAMRDRAYQAERAAQRLAEEKAAEAGIQMHACGCKTMSFAEAKRRWPGHIPLRPGKTRLHDGYVFWTQLPGPAGYRASCPTCEKVIAAMQKPVPRPDTFTAYREAIARLESEHKPPAGMNSVARSAFPDFKYMSARGELTVKVDPLVQKGHVGVYPNGEVLIHADDYLKLKAEIDGYYERVAQDLVEKHRMTVGEHRESCMCDDCV